MSVVDAIVAGIGISVAPNEGDVFITNTGVLSIQGGFGIDAVYTDISGGLGITLNRVAVPSLPSPRTVFSSFYPTDIIGNGTFYNIASIPIPSTWTVSGSGVNMIELQFNSSLAVFQFQIDGDGAFALGVGANDKRQITQMSPQLPTPGYSGLTATVSSIYNYRFRLTRLTDWSPQSTSFDIFAQGGFEWGYGFGYRLFNNSYIAPTNQFPTEVSLTAFP
jgi:hypothetical protein